MLVKDKANKKYERLRGKRDRLRFYRGSDGKSRTLAPKLKFPMHEIRRLTKEMRKSSFKRANGPKNYKRLRYVRYADDWIIGIVGSKDSCQRLSAYQVKEFIREHLKLTLTSRKNTYIHT